MVLIGLILLLLLFGAGFTIHAAWFLLLALVVIALAAAASGRTLW